MLVRLATYYHTQIAIPLLFINIVSGKARASVRCLSRLYAPVSPELVFEKDVQIVPTLMDEHSSMEPLSVEIINSF
jgi:hypothetical protein